MSVNNKRLSVWRTLSNVIKLALQRVAWPILELSAWENGNFGKPKEYIKPPFSFKEGRTPSRFIVEAFGLELGYDEPLTRPVDFQIERNKNRYSYVNGLGKTTLLKTILGLLKPVSGELVKVISYKLGILLKKIHHPILKLP